MAARKRILLHSELAAPREAVWTAFVETEVPRSYYFDTVLQAEREDLLRETDSGPA